MLTFKQYLESVTKPEGNYLSINVDASLVLPGFIPPKTGTEVPLNKQHVTLIYSEKSNIDPDRLLTKIQSEFPNEITAKVYEFACFDALPKDGERDENKSTLVVKLKSDMLEKIHVRLKQLGCSHSYNQYSAHVSLFYGVDRDECHRLVKTLNRAVKLPTDARLSGYTSERIIDDWSEKL